MITAPIIGIHRHRINTDGSGVTTLVGFWGCPLHCHYCLNPQSLRNKERAVCYSPEELYNKVAIDQLYFLATGGGITFGGGEPLLYPDFLAAFRKLCGSQWNITLETALNVPLDNLQKACEIVNYLMVDVKDINNDIYENYTGKNNQLVLQNLNWLSTHFDPNAILIKLPLIPHHNDILHREKSKTYLTNLGFRNIIDCQYIEEIHK